MKKLLSAFCCYLYVHCMAQTPFETMNTSRSASGEKVLVKALTAIVNREGNKRKPVNKIEVSAYEYP
jgi:hypothetical protein